MAHEVLNGADVGAALEEMGCERVAHAMATCHFGNLSLADRFLKLTLERMFVEMMPCDVAREGVASETLAGLGYRPIIGSVCLVVLT